MVRWWQEWRAYAQAGPDRYAERTQLPYFPQGATQQQFDEALAATPTETDAGNPLPPNAPKALGYDGPGPISNTALAKRMDDACHDLSDFLPGFDFVALSSGAWKKLKMWYTGGPDIEHVWVPRGLDSSTPLLRLTRRHIEVEVHLARDGHTCQQAFPKFDVLVRPTAPMICCFQCPCAVLLQGHYQGLTWG